MFADAELDGLIHRALDGNLGLAQARERMRRARIMAAHAGDSFLPELHGHAQPMQSPDGTDTFYQYGLDASWELGLFGRGRGTEQIAQGHLYSAASELHAIQVSVVAEVVRTYIELRTAQQAALLLTQMLDLEQQRIGLLEQKTALGLGAADAVVRARTALDHDRAALPLRHQDVDLAALRLAVLLGQPEPDPAWLVSRPLPSLSPFSFTTLPADLLRTRPEIRTAEAAVLEAAGELGVAQAELYPYVSLTGSFMYSYNVTQNFRRRGSYLHSIPRIGPIIDIPLFDWGRRRAAKHAREAELDEAVIGYRKAVVEAVAEVEAALATLQWQQERMQLGQTTLDEQAQSLASRQTQVKLGLSSQLQVLEEGQQQLQSQLDLNESQAGYALAFVALYKALGGAPLPTGPGV